jgi:hypothetical protein
MSENKAVQDLSHGLRLGVGVLLSSAILLGAGGSRDPEFDKVPFSDWLSGGPQTPLKWTERVLPVVLSVHQRLLARVQIQLDGGEGAKRRGEGELIFFFQLTDVKGRIYQDHTSYDLQKVEVGLKAQDLICTESAFVVPGDYAVSLAIYDTATKEHAVKKDKLRVLPLKTDPFPEMWKDAPAVEFVEPSEPPDHWYLPKAKGRLNLPLTPRRPMQIDVVANLTPAELTTPSYGVQDRTFSILFPSLKVVSEINAANAPMDVSLLDLARRRMVFHQNDVHELDWEKMKSSLANASSGSIDVKSLADRQHNAAFFIKEVARRIAPEPSADGYPTHVLIVLSGPMVFDADQDLQGIDLHPSPNARIYYFRLQTPPPQRPVLMPENRRRRGFGPYPGRPTMPGQDIEMPNGLALDQLEPMLRPLDPKLFDVTSADQFRKALATVLSDIANL